MATEYEVQAALDDERSAVIRMQTAFFELLSSRSPCGNGAAFTESSDVVESEALAAEGDWRARDAKFRRLVEES